MARQISYLNWKSGVVAIGLIVLVAFPVYNSLCRFTGFCSTSGLKWMWHMTHKDECGLTGQHLEPGREYYFEVRAATFLSDYPQPPPVSAEKIEPQEMVVVRKVYPNQKTDQETGYRRKRSPYAKSVDTAKLGLVVNGDYFFSVAENDDLGRRLTIDQALREPRYLKLSLYLQKVKSAEMVVRVSEHVNKYSYWPTTGYLKELNAYELSDGKRKDFRECYAESDGGHTPCPNPLKKS